MMHGARLRGRTILLAAGLPAKHEEAFAVPAFGGWDIDQAVTALARAVFAEGGRLVVQGDPALALLVAMVAGEYQSQRFAEGSGPRDVSPTPPLSVYPGAERSDREREDAALIEGLHLARIDALGQSLGVSASDALGTLIDKEDPEALVCIGGGEDVLRQARYFADRACNRPIFVLRHTGGAAARLADDPFFAVEQADVAIAEQVWTRARMRKGIEEFASDERRYLLGQKIVPYPVVMQLIVDRLAGGEGLIKA